MKARYLFMVFSLFLAACSGLFSKDKVSGSLSGTYVNQSASSYSRAFDTLLIAKQGDDGNIYSVDRNVSFNRIRHGKLQSNEYHMERWTAIYDDKKKILTGTKNGRALAYVPEKKILYLGNTVYLKIK